MTREEILNAPNEQLDEWCGTEIMGYRLKEDELFKSFKHLVTDQKLYAQNTYCGVLKDFPVGEWFPTTDHNHCQMVLKKVKDMRIGTRHGFARIFKRLLREELEIGEDILGLDDFYTDEVLTAPCRLICQAALLSGMANKERNNNGTN